MSIIDAHKTRMTGDPSNYEGAAINTINRQQVIYSPGNAWVVEVGIFDRQPTVGLSQVVDLQNIAYLRIEVKAMKANGERPTESDPPELSKDVTAGLIDLTLDGDSWVDGSKQHAQFVFTDAEVANSLAGRKLLCLTGVTTDATPATINYRISEIECIEDGGPSIVPAPPPGLGSAGGVGHSYVYDSNTADADPGSGRIRGNNANSSLISFFYVSNLDVAKNDLSDYYATFETGDSFHIQHLGIADNVGSYILSSNPIAAAGYIKFPVTARSTSGAFGDNFQVAVLLTASSAATGGYVHPNHTGEVTSVGDGDQIITNEIITNAKVSATAGIVLSKLQNIPGDSLVLNDTSAPGPALAKPIDNLRNITTPAAGVLLLGADGSGLGNVNVDDLPTPPAGGPNMGHKYLFDPTTTAGDPGAGKLRLNNVDPTNITEAYVSNIDQDGSGIADYIQGFVRGDALTLKDNASSENVLSLLLTDDPTPNINYLTVPCVYRSASGSFALDDELSVFFNPAQSDPLSPPASIMLNADTIDAPPKPNTVGSLPNIPNPGAGDLILTQSSGGQLSNIDPPDLPLPSHSIGDHTDVTKGSPAATSAATLRVFADPNQDGNYVERDWTPPSGGGGSPGGSDRDIQINDAGGFGASTWSIRSDGNGLQTNGQLAIGNAATTATGLSSAAYGPGAAASGIGALALGVGAQATVDSQCALGSPTVPLHLVFSDRTGDPATIAAKAQLYSKGGEVWIRGQGSAMRLIDFLGRVQDDPNPTLGNHLNVNDFGLIDSSGNPLLGLIKQGSNAVNQLAIRNSATGANLLVQPDSNPGSDPDVSVNYRGKGAGKVLIDSVPALSTTNTEIITNKTIAYSNNSIIIEPAIVPVNYLGDIPIGDYIIIGYWWDSRPGFFTNFWIKCSSGAGTVTAKINGTPITGLSSLSVTTTPAVYTGTAANRIDSNNQLTLEVTASSMVDLNMSFDVTVGI